jgi:cysteine-S-conjugate beta-lyase
MKNNVFAISDEIHRDILLEGRKFTSISELSEEASNKVVTLLSPGKTFNISSLTTAVVLIKNKEVAERYLNFTERYHINVNNALSNVAFKSVYARGEEWFEEFLRYLEGNIEYTKKYLEKYIPQARLTEIEGSYLAWIDLRYLNMDAKELAKRFLDDGKVAFDFGHWFGREGAGFIRINLACPREILKEALSRTHSVTSKIGISK